MRALRIVSETPIKLVQYGKSGEVETEPVSRASNSVALAYRIQKKGSQMARVAAKNSDSIAIRIE